MPERQQLEAVLVENLGWIDRSIRSICRRHGLRTEDAADFASWVKLRLIEDDYAIFRKFRGESAITTYLTVVIAMLLREYRVQRWGRWRPSAAARRMGDLAVRLEALVYRHGHRLDEAIQILRAANATACTDRELAEVYAKLPARTPVRPVEASPELLAAATAPQGADDLVETRRVEEDRTAAEQTLRQALKRLAPEDQVILRLRYWEGMSVADIARTLGLQQKPLYRRIEHSLKTLRQMLEAAGVSRDNARTLLNDLVA